MQVPAWRSLTLLAAALVGSYVITWPYLSESPRWLLAVGRRVSGQRPAARVCTRAFPAHTIQLHLLHVLLRHAWDQRAACTAATACLCGFRPCLLLSPPWAAGGGHCSPRSHRQHQPDAPARGAPAGAHRRQLHPSAGPARAAEPRPPAQAPAHHARGLVLLLSGVGTAAVSRLGHCAGGVSSARQLRGAAATETCSDISQAAAEHPAGHAALGWCMTTPSEISLLLQRCFLGPYRPWPVLCETAAGSLACAVPAEEWPGAPAGACPTTAIPTLLPKGCASAPAGLLWPLPGHE